MEPDDKRMVTTTVARLKAHEAATMKVAQLRVAKLRAGDALDAARLAYDAALIAESDAIDAAHDAAKILHGAVE